MTRRHTLLKTALLSVAASVVLAACGGGNDDNLNDRLNLASPTVRYVHAAQIAPAATFLRNAVAEPEATNKTYQFASVYKNINTGNAVLSATLAATGTPIGSAGTVNAALGHKYSAIALADPTSTALLLIDDPYNRNPTSSNARLRFANASVNAQNLDIYITAVGADLNAATPTFAAVGYRTTRPVSGSDSIELSANTYQLRFTTAGTKTVVFNTNIVLANNVDWLLITEPTDGIGATPNAIKLLRVITDDATQVAAEITTS
jgi:hypothetical protein